MPIIKGKKAFKDGFLSYRYTLPDQQENNPCLVMVHGALSDSRFFHRQMRSLGKMYRIIAPDLPGHGESRFDSWSGEDCISAIEEIIIHENASPAVIIAHSMAGPLALTLSARNPGLFRAIIMVSTASHVIIDKDLRERILTGNVSVDEFLPLIFSDRMARIASGFMNLQDSSILDLIRRDLAVCDSMDASSLCAGISVPVLCIASEDDRLIPSRYSRGLSDSIPGSRLVLLKGSTHVPFLENWKEFDMIIEDFLRYLT